MIKSLIVNYYSFHIFFATPVHWQGWRCLQRIHCLLKKNGSLYIFCNIFSLIEVCKRFIACLKKISSLLFVIYICWHLLTRRAQGSLQWEPDWQTWRQLCPLFHFSREKINLLSTFQFLNWNNLCPLKVMIISCTELWSISWLL